MKRMQLLAAPDVKYQFPVCAGCNSVCQCWRGMGNLVAVVLETRCKQIA